MWGRDDDPMYQSLATTRKNGFWELPDNVQTSSDLAGVLAASDYVYIIISAQGMRDLSSKIAAALATSAGEKTFILCMKGIDEETNETLSQLLRRELNAADARARHSICVWVGPGHIEEFLNDQPGVMIVDGEHKKTVEHIAESFKSPIMKLYVGEDLIGTELGAAAKNVLGIGAGILDGANMVSLKGALMARGAYEVSKLIVAMGGKKMTAYGLSHLGDFEATLFSRNSNNRRFGEALITYLQQNPGLKKTPPPVELARELRLPLAEGVGTSLALHNLAKKYNVSMPITETVYRIVHHGINPLTCFGELFMRDNLREFNFS